MRYYDDETLLNELEKLNIEQIRQISEELKEKYPANAKFQYLCSLAICRIKDRQERKEFAELIETKNAPSGATNTEQGNATR